MPTARPAEPSLVHRVVQQLPMEPETAADLEKRLHDTDKQVRSFVRENPTATVLGAVALGFLVGRMMTR